jgi:hypothetical protein
MLVIRKEQMAMFESHLGQRFRNQLRQHVKTEFPEQTRGLTDLAVDKRISEGVERARLYEITTERDLTLFVDLVFSLGLNFEQERKMAWAKKILLDPGFDGAAKMKSIYARLAAFENRAVEKARAP